MRKEYFYPWFTKKIKNLYITLISSIKNLFEKVFFSSTTIQEVVKEEQEIWFDALDNVESEHINADNQITKENDGYSLLQNINKAREKVNNRTLALAFQVEKDTRITNFSNLKLQNIYHTKNTVSLEFTDDNNNRSVLCSKTLNVYLPKHFNNHKNRFFDEVFSESQYGIYNHIVVLLQVPEELDFITDSPSSCKRNLLKAAINKFISIPESKSINLSKYEGKVKLSSIEGNNILLEIKEQLYHKYKHMGKFISTKTIWLIKDVLIANRILNSDVPCCNTNVTSIAEHIREIDKTIIAY
ncbi:MAG: hypothetical protein KTV77_02935 [Wolbachia endosymbiont of Fragariocoptes setiger]|nr:hypothetical protein [Wolbachia endosymbiont of Fragariocoptes setiger]